MTRSSSSSYSSSDDQSKKEPTQSSDTPNPHHNPATTTGGTTTATTNYQTGGAPTPPLGYPPAMGYPPPYQPYPPNAHHLYNHYTQPQPTHFYANQHYAYPSPTAAIAGGGGAGSAFVRGFLAMLITLITIICVASIITWLVLRPEIPIFQVEKFAVSNLNLTSPEFSAKWDASVVVENPNSKLKIYLDQVESFVYYKENLLSSSPVDPMFLETRSRNNVMTMRLATNNTEHHSVGRWVVDEIGKEMSGGGRAVSFNVRMLVLATFKSGTWWTRHASMKVFCDNLRINFVGDEISGALDLNNNNGGGKPKDCVVYYE